LPPPFAHTEFVPQSRLQLAAQLAYVEAKSIGLTGNVDPQALADPSKPLLIISPPASLPPFIASRADTGFIKIRSLVSSFSPSSAAFSETQAAAIGQQWARMGLGCSAVEQAGKLLTYDMASSDPSPKGQHGNAYARAFGDFVRSAKTFDGAVGTVPLVKGPPVIPGMVVEADNMRKGRRVAGENDNDENTTDMGLLGKGVLLSVIDSARIASKTTVEVAPYRHFKLPYPGHIEFSSEGQKRSWDGMDADGSSMDADGQLILYVKNDSRARNKRKTHDGYEEEDENERKAKAESRRSRLQKQNKVASAVAKSNAARSSAGPGVPILFQNTSKSFVIDRDNVTPHYLPPDTEVGDAARQTAETQRKRLVAGSSCPPGPKLNFGPFGAGFMNSAGGQSGVVLPRPISGIALPMGVNLRTTERAADAEPWNRLEDEALEQVTRRYGLNWQVASWVVSRAAETGALARDRKRSARQCLERWQALAGVNPSLQRAVRQRGEEWGDLESSELDECGGLLWKNMLAHDPDEHQFVGSASFGLGSGEVAGDRAVVDNR